MPRGLVVVAAADPVLDRPDAIAVLREARAGEQAEMRLEHDLHADRSAGRHRLHGPGHRLDVPQHLHGGDVAGLLAELASGLGAEQPAAPHLEALDPRGGHRLGAEQQPGERLGVGERAGRRIEPHERRLGIRNVGRNIPVEHEPPTGERVGNIDCVVTGAALAACLAARIAPSSAVLPAGPSRSLHSRTHQKLEYRSGQFKVGSRARPTRLWAGSRLTFSWASSPLPRVLIPLRDRRRPISHHGRKHGMKLRSCEKGCARLYLALSF